MQNNTETQSDRRIEGSLERVVMRQFTAGQRALIKKHGTPADFALAVYACCPSDISMDEAKAAVRNYRREFDAA